VGATDCVNHRGWGSVPRPRFAERGLLPCTGEIADPAQLGLPFGPQLSRQVARPRAGDQRLRLHDGVAGTGQDRGGQVGDGAVEIGGRNDEVHHPDPVGLRRVDPPPGDAQLHRPRAPDELVQRLDPAQVRDEPERHLGHAELRIIRDNTQITRQRELEPRADGVAVNSRDRDDVGPVQPGERLLIGLDARQGGGVGRRGKRRELAEYYESRLWDIPNLSRPKTLPHTAHAQHLFTVWIGEGKRDQVISELQKAGVGVMVNYRAIHLLSYFSETYGFKPGDFPVAERIGDATLSLPFYPNMSLADVDRVIEVLRDIRH